MAARQKTTNNKKSSKEKASTTATKSTKKNGTDDAIHSISSQNLLKNESRLYWVGIGASAGGLEALREMAKNLPKHAANITYMVAQHLSPKHQSMLVQLLGRETSLIVKEAKDGLKPEAGVIYITPPNSDLFVKEGRLRLRIPLSEHSPKPSVDLFFSTLAEELGDHAIGVILSGTGSDGSHGVRAIRAGGGLTIAQEVESAKYDGMPGNAIETGCIDIILPPEKIGAEISALIRSPHNIHLMKETEEKRTSMQELLHLLKNRCGVDFGDYKSGTILRRLNRRMTACAAADLDGYLEYVDNYPQELDMLFRDIMITVTHFFRDNDAFEATKAEISQIIKKKEEGDTIRVWVPGCATGEEAYSIVILFAEAAGGLSKLQQSYNFQLFATDIDIDALSLARKGVYAETTLEGVDQSIKDFYFRHRENSYEIIKAVRDFVVFSKHNVFDDPPFLRLDIITCRNLLIYFNNKLQSTVMGLFHYALNPNGILFLGKSESLGQSSNLFQTVDAKAKLFKRRLVAPADRARPANLSYFGSLPKIEPDTLSRNNKASHEFPDAIIGALSPDSLLIDENMDVLRIYGDVQAYTQLSAGDASTNLASIVRKEFRQELRAIVYKVLREGNEQTVLPKKLKINGTMHKVNIIIRPLVIKNTTERLLLISFERIQRIKEDAGTVSHGSDPVLAELEQELSATREHLQTVVEELETSNEELQSTNEEMQSTNEELQSSNEELETTNEELQSTNEELLTVNEELQTKSAELSTSNQDLANIKESIDIPILVVNNDLVITRYNNSAMDIFMLDDDAKGTALTNIATQIDIPGLRNKVMTVIETGNVFVRQLQGNNRYYYERIHPYKDAHGEIKGAVLTYIDNTNEQEILNQLKQSKERFDLAVQASRVGIFDWDIVTNKMYWSELLLDMLGIKNENFVPSFEEFEKRIHKDDHDDVMAILNEHLVNKIDYNVEFRIRKENGTFLWTQARGKTAWNNAKQPVRMTGSVFDITERRQTLEHLNSNKESLERFAYVCSHDLKEPARLIENFANLFHDKCKNLLDEEAQEYLQIIEDSASRMQEMIKGIHAYSQSGNKTLSVEEVDLETEFGRVLENLKLTVEESGAKISHDQLPIVKADKMMIFQVLQNLVGNALKFNKNSAPIIHVGYIENEEEWLFSVEDNGIGIKPEHTHKVFNVFQRLNQKEEYEGSGIGLSICQKNVFKHGGKIWVDSELGKGTTVYFTLPKNTQKELIENEIQYKKTG